MLVCLSCGFAVYYIIGPSTAQILEFLGFCLIHEGPAPCMQATLMAKKGQNIHIHV